MPPTLALQKLAAAAPNNPHGYMTRVENDMHFKTLELMSRGGSVRDALKFFLAAAQINLDSGIAANAVVHLLHYTMLGDAAVVAGLVPQALQQGGFYDFRCTCAAYQAVRDWLSMDDDELYTRFVYDCNNRPEETYRLLPLPTDPLVAMIHFYRAPDGLQNYLPRLEIDLIKQFVNNPPKSIISRRRFDKVVTPIHAYLAKNAIIEMTRKARTRATGV